MEKQEEKNIVKVFVNLNQKWQVGQAILLDENTYKVKTADGQINSFRKDSEYLEVPKQEHRNHKYGFKELQQRLEGAYISYTKLDSNVRNTLAMGKEYLLKTAYGKEGKAKESVRMLQMIYNPNTGSRLDVQIKRKETVKLQDANAYQYQFTKEEYNQMLKEGKTVLFTGTSLEGGKFQKLAYYEPRLNDIRTKSALSTNTMLLGQMLTKDQADAINKGIETKITIKKTRKGPLTYMVSWSPKIEEFITKNLEKAQSQEVGKKELMTVDDLKKKKQPNAAISL
ncbi:hypothetical protein [Maribacter sp. 4G9]|uniref:hypothetical protein n=1 Tax=Maribacter sp. 4G9 TaxID=1889777 RepID=UPI000C162702|nr:hypothetical protein [Maribacter sp. 4G9]PIB31466.1 hypothetical protein BFP75_01580 [Maribacter sp. 4G9]